MTPTEFQEVVRRVAVAATLLLLGALPAAAHSVNELETELYKRDVFFQSMDRVAPPFALETADGRRVALSDFKGKVVVLDFVYARCKEECPLQSNLLASIQRQINLTPMRDLVEFVSVATDTEAAKPTAAIMRGYGAAHGFDPANWVFLYGGPGQPRAGIDAAAAYGLKFTITKDGDQMHGVVTHVIDQAGHLRARFHGLKFDPTDLIMFVNALTNEHPGKVDDDDAAAPAAGTRIFDVPGGGTPPIWFDVLLAALPIGFAASAVAVFRKLRKPHE